MKLLLTLVLPLMLNCPARAADWALWHSLITESYRLVKNGDYPAALPVAIRAVELARRADPSDARHVDSLNTIGFIHRQIGAYRAAEESFLEAIAISRALPDQPQLAFSLDHLAFLYRETGRPASEIESLRRQALDLAVAKLGPDAPEVGVLLAHMASSSIDRRKFNEGEAQLKRALQLISKNQEPAVAGDMYLDLGAVAYYKGKYSEALESLHRAGRLYLQSGGPDSPGLVRQLISLGAVYLKTNRALEADQALEQAERIASNVYGPEHQRVAEVLHVRIRSLRKLGKRMDAAQAYERIRRIDAARRTEVNAVNSRVDVSLTYK